MEEAKEDLAESLPVEEDAKSQPVTEPQAPVGLLDAATPEKENNSLLDNGIGGRGRADVSESNPGSESEEK